jgi:AcrR family transcriptional regulator
MRCGGEERRGEGTTGTNWELIVANERMGNGSAFPGHDLRMNAGRGTDEIARLEKKASQMHTIGRLRGKHFLTPVMADSAMEVMLSLFVGELQSTKVSDTALSVANLLSREETESVIDRLVQAGLAVITGHEPDRRTVGLTPLGSARMRSYVNDYPDV